MNINSLLLLVECLMAIKKNFTQNIRFKQYFAKCYQSIKQ